MARGFALIACRRWDSEAKRQELGAAGGITVGQGAEANLVGDAGTCDRLCDNADHNPEHGGPSVKELGALELLHEDQLFLAVLKKLFVG